MKRIPFIPPKSTFKLDKLVDMVARHNPKVYDRKFNLVELEDWTRGIDVIVEVPEENKVNREALCLEHSER